MLRLFRGVKWDAMFPPDRMVPALESTLADLGIDLRGQSNVHVDIEPRPSKDPRAFCAPVLVPSEVHLVIPRVGGRDDYDALMHEAGHAEHYAHVDPSLPWSGWKDSGRGLSLSRLGFDRLTRPKALHYRLPP